MDMYNCIQKYLTPPAIVVIYKSEMNIFFNCIYNWFQY